MSGLEVFDYAGQQFRTVLVGVEPWFVASDVARILGYRMSSDMTRRIDEDEKGTRSVRTPGGDQDMAVISEPGLYIAIIGSQVTEARSFKRWLTHDVLPRLRRTGSYGVPELDPMNNVDHLALIVQAGHAALTRAIEAEAKVAAMEPAAEAWEALSSPDADFSVREAAQVLSRDETITIGQNRLFQFLREIHWIDQRNGPYQSQVDPGRLVRRITDYTDDFGVTITKIQPRVTAKGIAELRKRLAPGTENLTLLPGGAA